MSEIPSGQEAANLDDLQISQLQQLTIGECPGFGNVTVSCGSEKVLNVAREMFGIKDEILETTTRINNKTDRYGTDCEDVYYDVRYVKHSENEELKVVSRKMIRLGSTANEVFKKSLTE